MLKAFFCLLKGGTVLAPDNLGQQDILVAGSKIAAIGKNLSLPSVGEGCEVDVSGCFVDTWLYRQPRTYNWRRWRSRLSQPHARGSIVQDNCQWYNYCGRLFGY